METVESTNYYLESNTTFSWWVYLPFLDFFLESENLAMDFDTSDFWIYYSEDSTK